MEPGSGRFAGGAEGAAAGAEVSLVAKAKTRHAHWRLRTAAAEKKRAEGKKRRKARISSAIDVDAVMGGQPAAAAPKTPMKGRRVAARGSPKKRARTDFKVYRGRSKGTKELYMFEKSQVVDWAIAGEAVEWNRNRRVYVEKARQKRLQPPSLDTAIRTKTVCDWANERLESQWGAFDESPEMQRIFGSKPSMTCKRIARVWRAALGKDGGPGRRSFLDLYATELDDIAEEFKRLHKADRESVTHDDPDWETMYTTFESLMKQFNEERSKRAERPVVGDRADGGFSFSWVPDLSGAEKTAQETPEGAQSDPTSVQVI